MNMPRRKALRAGAALVAAAGLVGLASGAWAQAPAAAAPWPAKPLRLIVPFPGGGNVDTLARVLGEAIAARTGVVVNVEPKPGANTIVGAQEAARAAPDGHTFMLTTMSTTVNNRALYAKLPYDAERDFAPVTQLSYGAVLLVGPANAPYTDLKGLFDWVRKQGKPVNYGSWGVGSAGHLYGVMLEREHGLALNHVPYKGDTVALADVKSGTLDLTFASPTSAKPMIAAGAVRPIAMAGASRSASMPELATFGEQGVKGLELPLWLGVYAPAGTPRPAVDRMRAELVAAMQQAPVRERMLSFGFTPIGNTPEEFAAAYRADYPRWEAVIRASGAKVE